MEEGKTSRLVLPCADDHGIFMCYLCHKYVLSLKTLYGHMRSHTDSDWREVLPETLKNCTAVIVRHALFNPLLSDPDEYSSDDDPSMNEEEYCYGSVVDLTKALPEWNTTGKVKNKRGRSDFKKDQVLPAKKLKMSATDKDEVVLEAVARKTGGGANVIFGFDLNDDLVIATEDEQP